MSDSDVASFLAAHPPFAGLGREQLEAIAATVEERAFAAGATALVEDGTPASVFYVIATGAMELVHQEEVIDILEPGEAFGHPSLLTGRTRIRPATCSPATPPSRRSAGPPASTSSRSRCASG
jgi:signal-transduction protein with cAMP-binding, CBS, and nucleotidyltransferase domain